MAVLRFTLYALTLLTAAALAFRPDFRDELRRADALFVAGRYHEVLPRYVRLSAEWPVATTALRLGMLRTLRGEYSLAERALRHSVTLGLRPDEHDLAMVYLGYTLTGYGQPLPAAKAWALVRNCTRPPCPYDAARRVLRAEEELRRGAYAAAESDYRAALAAGPSLWSDRAHLHLALLLAARDPGAARDLLAAPRPPALSPSQEALLLAPLLPPARLDPGQLAAVLAADPAEQAPLLGRLYLDLQLYDLAEVQFNRSDPQGAEAVAAAAYAAYARWRTGDIRGGREHLEQLVATHPADSRVRTLLALAYLAERDEPAAQAQLEALTVLAPGDPETHLAWASWYVARSDYIAASIEYRRALERAPPEKRGTYALAVARLYLGNNYELCAFGLPAAEQAVISMPTGSEALATLAASRYHCGDFRGAAASASAALDINASADAAYYLGASLRALGETQAARTELVRAADLAPASDWRIRAERILETMP